MFGRIRVPIDPPDPSFTAEEGSGIEFENVPDPDLGCMTSALHLVCYSRSAAGVSAILGTAMRCLSSSAPSPPSPDLKLTTGAVGGAENDKEEDQEDEDEDDRLAANTHHSSLSIRSTRNHRLGPRLRLLLDFVTGGGACASHGGACAILHRQLTPL